MDSLAEALRYLEQGEWEKAHAIVQNDESPLASWMHGIVHLQEGELDNARYWYTRARRPLPDPPDVKGELQALSAALLASPHPTGG
jgi:Tfp pilus assembly protein PilF